MTNASPPGFTQMDDSTLLRTRELMRAELERLPPNSAEYTALAARCDASLNELVERARVAWAREQGRTDERDDARPPAGRG